MLLTIRVVVAIVVFVVYSVQLVCSSPLFPQCLVSLCWLFRGCAVFGRCVLRTSKTIPRRVPPVPLVIPWDLVNLGDPLGARGSWDPFDVLLILAEGNGGRCDARELVRLLPTRFVELRKLDVRNACSVSAQPVVCWSMALLLLMAPIATAIASVLWSIFPLQCHVFLLRLWQDVCLALRGFQGILV